MNDSDNAFLELIEQQMAVIEPGLSSVHSAHNMRILKGGLSMVAFILNALACYLPYAIIRKRFPQPSLQQSVHLKRAMAHTYCILTAFGSGLLLGAVALYSWPLADVEFQAAAGYGGALKTASWRLIMNDSDNAFLELIEQQMAVIEPGLSSVHSAHNMRILKGGLSMVAFILNALACYLPYAIIRKRFPQPSLQQSVHLKRAMAHTYCILTAFGSGLLLGAVALYSWPLADVEFQAAAGYGRLPKGYRLAELTAVTMVIGLFLLERMLLVITGRVSSSRDYLSPTETTFVLAENKGDDEAAYDDLNKELGGKAWRLRNQEARVTAETEGRDIEDSGFEPNLIQRTLPTKRGLFLSARGVALLLSLLLSGCFSPFLEGVAIGTAPGPKGACVLFLAIAFREAFANLILGYQLAITRGDIVYTHVHMVFSAVILSIDEVT
ncbi:unnamed protein product [Notodromas monacha]|uniref:Uncharacterized protein n=1 Tax=Notodromas monacha TaxID=399045 RepID=A0A7R9GFE9_9CRUS|nr:unnamed protein product [Notodromas monacha]CAG0919071.1 unnamed protein product [Notodromas monacha]